MKITVGDKIEGIINNIKDNGVYVTFKSNSGYGFMQKNLMHSLLDRNGLLLRQKGDKITVVVFKISDKDFITLTDEVWYENSQNRQERFCHLWIHDLK